MRSANTDSAASPGDHAWDHVDWPIVHRRVRGLQIRIAKATRDQDWRRVKALQRFLVNSYSAKALAVKRVWMARFGPPRKPSGAPSSGWTVAVFDRSRYAGCTSPSAAARRRSVHWESPS